MKSIPCENFLTVGGPERLKEPASWFTGACRIIVVYRVKEDVVEILHIWHASQDRG